MILLDTKNKALEQALIYKFSCYIEGSKLDKTDIILSDFDGVIYHISNVEGDKTKLIVSVGLKYFKELQSYGADEYLKKEYKTLYMYPPEPGYDFSLLLDLKLLCDNNDNNNNQDIPNGNEKSVLSPQVKEQINDVIYKTCTLKRNCLASVFSKFFDIQVKLSNNKDGPQNKTSQYVSSSQKIVTKTAYDEIQPSNSDLTNGFPPENEELKSATDNEKPAIIHYREDEAMYIEAKHDRTTVIFSTIFQDEDDATIGKIFLQEFKEGRKASQNAPHVLFSPSEPPKELRDRTDVKILPNTSYITFVLFPRHTTTQQCRENTIDLLCMFRNYLHYHIKCSKAYIHSRMRIKTTEFLKILNRAKPEKSTKCSLRESRHRPTTGKKGIITHRVESNEVNHPNQLLTTLSPSQLPPPLSQPNSNLNGESPLPSYPSHQYNLHIGQVQKSAHSSAASQRSTTPSTLSSPRSSSLKEYNQISCGDNSSATHFNVPATNNQKTTVNIHQAHKLLLESSVTLKQPPTTANLSLKSKFNGSGDVNSLKRSTDNHFSGASTADTIVSDKIKNILKLR